MIIKKITNRIYYINNMIKKSRTNSEQRINWAIIGLGNMANVFAKALCVTPEANLVAVASRSDEKAKAFAKKYNAKKYYGSYEELLLDKELKIDIVYIATPLECHYENIRLVLNHNHNVLCEKPFVISTKELRELKQIAHEKRLFLAEGMWMKCLPVNIEAAKWIKENKIGTIESLRVDLSKREILDFNRKVFQNHLAGGVMYDYGVYAIAFVNMFMGKDINIEYVKEYQHKNGFDTEWIIVIKDEHDVTATITISSRNDGDKKAVLFGNLGSIVWEAQFNRTNELKCYDNTGRIIDTYKTKYIADGFEFEIQEVQKCILMKKNESNILCLDESEKVLELITLLKEYCK